MTIVLVHGVPETAAVWRRLLSALADRGHADVVTLSPPGFGAPAPDGWDAFPRSYAQWLVGELERFDEPVDLVGHDWGAGHVYGLLATRPDLVRTWAADVAGLIHRDYVWHDMAQAWQTPGVGEQVIEMMVAQSIDERRATLEGAGLDPETAAAIAEGITAEMGRCILSLYRGAVPPFCGDLGAALAASDLPPGLVIDPTEDAFVDTEMGHEVAASVGADILVLEGQGHWWMASAADEAADGLLAFWNRTA